MVQVGGSADAASLDSGRPVKRAKHTHAINFAKHFSEEGRLRQYPSLRKIICQFTDSVDAVPMHGGLPPSDSFPISSLLLRLKDGQAVDLTNEQKVASAQQYCTTVQGYPALHSWCETHTKTMHNPPGRQEVLITNGSNHALEMVCELLLERGDYVLAEEYTYPSVIESVIIPKGYKPLGVKLDQNGIRPESLLEVIKEHKESGRRPPHVFYTVPTGQNPTGTVTTLERKQRIYEICSENDIVIIEDDPYYYLQYSLGPGEAFGFEGLGQTYLSLDVDERVVRLDSFSKFLAPGMRLGWVTAHPDMLQKICFALHASTMGPCSFTQVVMYELLDAWGRESLISHVKKMQTDYKNRAAIVQEAAEKQLAKYAEWHAPRAGMFLWLKLKHVEDSMDIFEELKEAKVVVVPGKASDTVLLLLWLTSA
ncbi:hypothetical protein ABBQ32_013719 [Trebouxia sp. C0010 RCD-2024]